MRVTAESTAHSGTPKVNNVCFIITYSQCDISHLSRAEFADILARPAKARKLHRLPKICNERDSQYTALYALYGVVRIIQH